MASLNKVTLIGNLGRDPEIKSTQSGTRLANFTVATSEQWRDRSTGEKVEKTEGHRVTIWKENLVDLVDKYLRKGDKLYVEGRLETRKWTDQSGAERYSTEVVVRAFGGTIILLERRGNGASTSASNGHGRLADRDVGDAHEPRQ